MSIILGIDIGGSTTKIVGLRPDGSVIAKHRVQAQDPITSLYGAMGNFLFTRWRNSPPWAWGGWR